MANELATNNVTHLPTQHPGVRQVSSWRGIRPTTMAEALKLARTLAFAPNMLPRSYVTVDNRPREFDEIVAMVFSAIQMGAEVGLSPMASVQNIAVINGKPGLYGPAMLAVVEASGLMKDIEETIKGSMADRDIEAVCTVERIGRKPRTFTFSFEDAMIAKLIGKRGPWTEYPKRMFIARARTFALRDVFPDVLAGLSQSVEELIDIPAEDYREVKIVIPPGESMDDLLEPPVVDAPITPEYIAEFEKSTTDQLGDAKTLDALESLWKSGINAEVRAVGKVDKAAQKRIIAAFTQRKNKILKASQPDQDGVDMSDSTPAAAVEHEPQQEAQQKPVQAEKTAAATERRDHIDNALDELRRGDNGIPAPVAIKVTVGADGSKNWSAFFNAAKAVFREAVDGEYGEDWLARWLDANGEALVELKQANKVADDKLAGMYAQAKDYLVGLRKEAEAEATKEFPTLNVGVIAIDGDEDNTVPNWPAFVRNLHAYLDDTPNHRVAAAWWHRHKVQVSYMAKAGEIEKGMTGAQAAAEFTKALFARFPQIAD